MIAIRECASGAGRQGLSQLRALLLAGTVVLASPMLPALAQNATWLVAPGSGDFNSAANWSPATVPTGTAFFGASAVTGLSFSTNTTVGGLTFNPGASAYTFTNGQSVQLNGAGIAISGGSATIRNMTFGRLDFSGVSTAGGATIDNRGALSFNSASNAGSAAITNSGGISFDGNSTAGNAVITNFTSIYFGGTSSGSNATITNYAFMVFGGSSTAGNAVITNSGGILIGTGITFEGNSTAGNATIDNINGSSICFTSSTTAGAASISNSGLLLFGDNSTAGSATVINRSSMGFGNTSTASNATISNIGSTSFLVFGGSATAGNATISNTGVLYFIGAGTAGSAMITNNGGGLRFSETSAAGSATIVNSGTLAFIGSSRGDSAQIVNTAGGVFDMSGLVTAGTTVGSIEGAGTFFLGSKQLSVGSNGLSTTVSGVISDGGVAGGVGGSLIKVGPGTLTLTGTNAYTGPTTVNGGALAVNGSLVSSVTANTGGALLANGSIAGNVNVNGGAIGGGGIIGGLTVTGNFVQNGGTYVVDANAAGQSDRINVGGKATINGGAVQVVAQSGSYARNTTYTIVNAVGGVTGAFSSVNGNFAFLTPTLSYDANNVYLLLGTNSFASGAQTANQYAVGAALDQANASATGDFANVLNAIGILNTAQGPAALNAISGQNYSGFSSSMVQGAQLFMSNFLTQAGGGSDGTNKVALAQACDVACQVAEPPRWGAWGGALGGAGTLAGNANAGPLTYNVGGFAAGLDRKFGESFRGGLTVGYLSGQQWVGGFDGKGISNTVTAGVYGGYAQGPVYLDGIAGYAYSGNQMRRTIAIPGLQPRTAQGLTGANQFYGQVEMGYRVDLGGVASVFVTPFARLQGFTGTQNAFTETGAQSLNLNVAAQTTNSLRSVLGAQVGGSMDMGWREKLNAWVRLGWSHEYANTYRPVTASFAGASTIPFTTYGASPQRDGVVIGLAANTQIAEATSTYLRYEGNISGQDSSHALTAGVRMTW